MTINQLFEDHVLIAPGRAKFVMKMLQDKMNCCADLRHERSETSRTKASALEKFRWTASFQPCSEIRSDEVLEDARAVCRGLAADVVVGHRTDAGKEK